MNRSRLPSVARQLLNEVPDADLLERYALHRADDAFAQLVARYNRLVWGVCRNLLPDDADADDAFQATFLTLARSVQKIKPGAPLGPWLHGVAYRVCRNARRSNARRAKWEKAAARTEAAKPVADSAWESAFAAVAEEVQTLPESLRIAFVLCGIEGRSKAEAAAALGQRVGTVSTRLSRARQTLLDRLAKRGLGMGAIALGGVTGGAAVAPAALVDRALALLPSGTVVPSSIQSLTQGVTGMALIRIKVLAASVLVAAGLSLSAGGGWFSSASGQTAPKAAPATPATNKTDPNLEKLRADLEKAKAELAKAEEELRAKSRLDYAQQLARAYEALKGETKLAPKFEYEPVPKGGNSPEEFEKKIAEREKQGWAYLGEATIRGKDGSGPALVFRKKPAALAAWLNDMNPNQFNPHIWGPGELNPLPSKPTEAIPPPPLKPTDAIPPAISKPRDAIPPPPLKPTDKLPPAIGSPPPPGRNFENNLPLFPPTDFGPNPIALPTPHGSPELDRIDRLEKLVEELRAASGRIIGAGIPPAPGAKAVPKSTIQFTQKDFGTWDPADLMAIVDKLLADKPYGGKNLGFVLGDGILQISGTPEAIDEIKGLVKKLRK